MCSLFSSLQTMIIYRQKGKIQKIQRPIDSTFAWAGSGGEGVSLHDLEPSGKIKRLHQGEVQKGM